MDANESPFDVPDEIKEEIWDEVKKNSFARYYDPTSELNREALALYTNLNKDQIMVGNGADEILSIILFTFAGTGREVIFPTPTFPIYETFKIISGANPVKIPLIKPQKITGYGNWIMRKYGEVSQKIYTGFDFVLSK